MYTPIDLSKIQKLDFPENQFYKNITPKRQICLHHTASGKGIDGDFQHWLNDPTRVATAVIVGYDGQIYSLFDSKYWGHHLGIKPEVFTKHGMAPNNEGLNKACIGIEIDAWGPLALHDGHYKSYTGTIVNINEVQLYRTAFKTYPQSKFFDEIGVTGKPAFHYHKYSDAQLYSTAQLLQLWTNAYEIPKKYNEKMWDVCVEALRGDLGIWSHVSYRSDKQDCHPQPELIGMLKSI
jgi:hypothetical protein